MTTGTFTNVARDDLCDVLARPGVDHGPDVYAFYDAVLCSDYKQLVTPDRQTQHMTAPQALDELRWTLGHSWLHTAVTSFASVEGQAIQWPFTQTTVVERDPHAFPTDHGRLDADNLGAEITTLLNNAAGPPATQAATEQAADEKDLDPPAPAAEITAPLGPTPTQSDVSSRTTNHTPRPASVLKPVLGNIRTRRYHIRMCPCLQTLVQFWRHCVCIIENEAICLVNMAPDKRHRHLGDAYMKALLANETSAFVQKHPFLANCPGYIHCSGIVAAIAARKSLIKRFVGQGIPEISSCTAEKEQRRSFHVAFAATAGFFEPQYKGPSLVPGLEPRIAHLKLRVCHRSNRRAQGHETRL